jgi:hypothetical protein
VDYLIQQLEAGKSETLTAYLGAMARFHNYSFGNILAIARQRPTATRVAGFGTWKEMGRFVKKGEKGIQILAPMIGYRRKKDDAEQDRDASAKPQPMLIGFPHFRRRSCRRLPLPIPAGPVPAPQRPAPTCARAYSNKEEDQFSSFVKCPASRNGLGRGGRTRQGSPHSLR